MSPDALFLALQIQLRVTPKSWPEALKTLPEELRPAAEEYLRGIAQRMRVLRAMRRE